MINSNQKVTAIITDLDGCLWRGTLAENQIPVLNKRYLKGLKHLYKKGIQIFVISKNNSEDVHKAFFQLGVNTNMFTGVIANWEPKYLNIEKLIFQTGLRSETIIFIDDNPLEKTEVKIRIPKIRCYDMLESKKLFEDPYFRKLTIQDNNELQERINRYKTAIAASKQKLIIKEDVAFLRSLKREVAVAKIKRKVDQNRFAKLLALTHRINFNPGKYRSVNAAILGFARKLKKGAQMYGVSVWESGLSLGLSGGFIVRIKQNKAFIQDATFSCGIMGRDFEQKSIIELIRQLKEIGVVQITFSITPTSTNLRVNEILNELEFKKNVKNNSIQYTLELHDYEPVKSYNWISVVDKPNFNEHGGIPSIINFFASEVRPIIHVNFNILNLGAGRNEVLGHLIPKKKKEFDSFILKNNLSYIEVDQEAITPSTVVANAENLESVFHNSFFDLVMAIELLEHTEHFWSVISEMIRVCKITGYIFISVPTFNYPKHDYPVDLWRIGPKTLLSFFPEKHFRIVRLEKEGNQTYPRRLLLLVQKKNEYKSKCHQPRGGKVDWLNGITIFK